MLVLAVVVALPGWGEEPKLEVWAGASVRAQRPVPWNTAPLVFQGRAADFRFRAPLRTNSEAFRARRAGTPGATVVVWGDASMDRQEEMLRFTRNYSPGFRNAFDAGLASGIGAQFLQRLMELSSNPNQKPAPAHASPVWYNAMDPWARDPKYRR